MLKKNSSVLICCAVALVFVASSLAQTGAVPPPVSKSTSDVNVKLDDEGVKIDPSNTRVEFVGTHVGDDPKPRLGGFKKFSGSLKFDVKSLELESINVTFDINSIWTEFNNLTNHLKAADFFNAKEFGEAKFESTDIEKKSNGEFEVTGKLTMLGVTGDLTFPASVEMKNGNVKLTTEFKFDRTEFGMTKMTQGVEKAVSIKVQVGKKTLGKRADK